MILFNKLSPIHNQIRKELLATFEKVYDSNWYILGGHLKSFEKKFANYLNTTHALGVGNGLDALKISLKAIGIKAGDEVIVPANAFIATVLAVTDLGAIPVLVEPTLESFNINPDLIEEKITDKTKAIIPIHLFGLPCEMDKIIALSKKYNIPVIEDNAQGVGASFKNQYTGSFGLINATSFYPTKNLGALGDGGAITTSNAALASQVSLLRNYGSEVKYYHEIEGYNSRLDELQAALLEVKLNYLNEWNLERINLANNYTKKLEKVKGIITPTYDSTSFKHVFHLYVIRHERRDSLQAHLLKNGIQTQIHYPVPFYKQKAYLHLGLNSANYPISNLLAETSLSLPLYPGLTKDDQDEIIDCIFNFPQPE